MNSIEIDADGVKFTAQGMTTGDVLLRVEAEGREIEAYMSHAAAVVFAMALAAIGGKDDPTS